ncbi:sulfurtransferase TusE [Candidatus Pantoea edessiphila]|uniref:Sulfurtransferase n=1 Tax=Candidatus Pantoea edessiphila TaxID=2044610 RepID=A0A2P5T2D7_9GAMM|nr:TusE/DsrC/DsvC family sulfur relay protein [Candidatus Pantoea edessiphila]PPI88764.1 sulfurtransferase TusE [Candidatus Pantoea edessiphila]
MKSNDKIIEYDIEGYLKNSDDWNEDLAVKIALQENISMTVEHWSIIYFIRSFYLKYNISPKMRMLAMAIANQYGKEKGNSCYLFHLFPKGIIKQATKIAGIPKPNKCL